MALNLPEREGLLQITIIYHVKDDRAEPQRREGVGSRALQAQGQGGSAVRSSCLSSPLALLPVWEERSAWVSKEHKFMLLFAY